MSITINPKQTSWTRQCNPYTEESTITKKEMKAAVKVEAPKIQLAAGGGVVKAPLPGTVIEVKVKIGDEVKEGQTVVVLEAMKMNNNLEAVCDGKVTAIEVNSGDAVKENTVLVVVE
ncbi:MAG: biotin/lipoyl-binding protein [Bacteroidaceae bacterium]|nr:biotin/lipoyl-binding protein [Bacteroidaceae bacterium]